MPTLLHISDLHRSPDEPIDNDTLLAAITADLDRFAMVHEAPEALVVSGDLVQGVKLGSNDFDREMGRQYETAFDFVRRLCDEVLGRVDIQRRAIAAPARWIMAPKLTSVLS